MKILIGCPVNESGAIFDVYLKSLRRLELPEDVKVEKHFIFHNCDHSFLLKDGESFEFHNDENERLKSDTDHKWTNGAVGNVILMKNRLLEVAVERDCDYIFLVDSDLLLHPKVLVNLLQKRKMIIAGMYWTDWKKDGNLQPNCWNFDDYGFLKGFEELIKKQKATFIVGGTGACILIHKSVFYPLDKGGLELTYERIPNISSWGEDRHFCIRCYAHNIPIYCNNEYPIWHIYRDEDFEKMYGEYCAVTLL